MRAGAGSARVSLAGASSTRLPISGSQAVGEQAGTSKRQQMQAIHLANLPAGKRHPPGR